MMSSGYRGISAEAWTWRLTPTIAKVKNEWSHVSSLPLPSQRAQDSSLYVCLEQRSVKETECRYQTWTVITLSSAPDFRRILQCLWAAAEGHDNCCYPPRYCACRLVLTGHDNCCYPPGHCACRLVLTGHDNCCYLLGHCACRLVLTGRGWLDVKL